MPETANPTYVGLDISKARLDYTTDEKRTAHVANDREGHNKLIEWLKTQRQPRVVCEPSGGYERPVVRAILAAGIELCLPHAGRARYYALSEGLLAKTDRIDAQMLRRYGQAVKLRLAEPPNPAVAVLRDLVGRRRSLVARQVELQGQLETASEVLSRWLQRELRFVERELEAVEREISSHIDSEPDLKKKYLRLQELEGAGPVLASTLLAYVPELGCVEDATAAALLGLAPYAKDTGTSNQPRHIGGGRAEARHVLYMGAVCAIQHNPILKAFYERLRANGKPPKVCLVAVMRKMATLLNRLLADPDFKLAN